MFTKRQKKLLSRYLREKVRRGMDERNLASISDSWHWVRCPWDDEMSCQYALCSGDSYSEAVNWCIDTMNESRNGLPYYDCSGRSFYQSLLCWSNV